jgi:hypothetical protein
MRVNLEYFQPSGKWKYDGNYNSTAKALYEIWAEVRALAVLDQLPGLISGHWEGFISVDVPRHPCRHPHLVVLKGEGL